MKKERLASKTSFVSSNEAEESFNLHFINVCFFIHPFPDVHEEPPIGPTDDTGELAVKKDVGSSPTPTKLPPLGH